MDRGGALAKGPSRARARPWRQGLQRSDSAALASRRAWGSVLARPFLAILNHSLQPKTEESGHARYVPGYDDRRVAKAIFMPNAVAAYYLRDRSRTNFHPARASERNSISLAA